MELRVLLDHLGDPAQVPHVDARVVQGLRRSVAIYRRGLVLQAIVDLCRRDVLRQRIENRDLIREQLDGYLRKKESVV